MYPFIIGSVFVVIFIKLLALIKSCLKISCGLAIGSVTLPSPQHQKSWLWLIPKLGSCLL